MTSPLHDRVWNELAARGAGPRLVRVGLHPETLLQLEAERAAAAPNWAPLPPATEVFGFDLVEDPLAPKGVVLLRDRAEGKAP